MLALAVDSIRAAPTTIDRLKGIVGSTNKTLM